MLFYENSNPLITVVMPTFNRGEYLKRAVDSVINQSFTDWELLIVDDGSTDDTFLIVSEFIKHHVNIRYMKHSNRKPPFTNNAGITAAAGEFVTFLGSDDEFKPDHLKIRMDFFREDPGLDLIHGGVEVIGHPFVKDKNDLTKEIHISECVVGATFFARKKLFTREGGFKNIPYSDDSEFFERIEGRYKIKKVDPPTYVYYRDTPDSICTNIL